ncbi:MAG: DoxX family protein [Candidatus Omnitrophica bacterium]|nr:DoxX family protein [Candidatus Omnitrophota bacterium]
MKDWASVPLRLGLGIMFMYHGLQKAFGLFGGSGINGFANMLKGLGFTQPVFWAYVVACTELIGGLLLILGILTRAVSILLIVVMVVAIAKVHLPNGFSFMKGGYEYNFIIICACIALSMLGGGRLSVNKKM